jgi:hypothetical protein
VNGHLAYRQDVRDSIARARLGLAGRIAPLLALPVILVHLAGTVGADLHFALVDHERCPLHGEMVHGSQAASAANAALVSDTEAANSAVVEEGNGTNDCHDVCSLTTALHRRALEPQSKSMQHVETVREGAQPPDCTAPLLVSRCVYRVAPKTSPPRA